MTVKMGINGFGRIGRLVLRAVWNHPEVQVVAINDLAQDDRLQIDDKSIAIRSIKEPSKIGWEKLGVDIVAECTGLFRDREGASGHLTAGARKVIISAPASDPDITLVMGVNSNQYDPRRHHIISNASCTTNCLAPVAKVILENFGLKSGLMTTIHAYTGDQRLLDFPHKDLRRARAAALSMLPTTTGAAKAVALVMPELDGKLNGLAIRVPTPNVSLVDFVAAVEKPDTTKSEVNAALKSASEGSLAGILGYSEEPLVSIDYNGSSFSSVVDAPTTYVVGNMIKVLSWYDNESGYSHRMVDLVALIGSQF